MGGHGLGFANSGWQDKRSSLEDCILIVEPYSLKIFLKMISIWEGKKKKKLLGVLPHANNLMAKWGSGSCSLVSSSIMLFYDLDYNILFVVWDRFSPLF